MKKVKRKPTHPGNILKEDYLVPLDLTVTEMSHRLGVSRKTLSKVLNEKGAVTPDMALRLSRAFNTTPDLWLNLQKNRYGPVGSFPVEANLKTGLWRAALPDEHQLWAHNPWQSTKHGRPGS